MSNKERKRINEVLTEYSERGIKLTVRRLKTPDVSDDPTILIEGDADAFKFFGELLMAYSIELDDGFELSPRGPGSNFFKDDSTEGLYFHRLPCSTSRSDGIK
jgi:hypothetical protein